MHLREVLKTVIFLYKNIPAESIFCSVAFDPRRLPTCGEFFDWKSRSPTLHESLNKVSPRGMVIDDDYTSNASFVVETFSSWRNAVQFTEKNARSAMGEITSPSNAPKQELLPSQPCCLLSSVASKASLVEISLKARKVWFGKIKMLADTGADICALSRSSLLKKLKLWRSCLSLLKSAGGQVTTLSGCFNMCLSLAERKHSSHVYVIHELHLPKHGLHWHSRLYLQTFAIKWTARSPK